MYQLFCYILSLISITTLVLLTSDVSTQPDLCRNPKVDSIEWIESQKQFFFTSGGYWWLIKESEMPPPAAKAQRLKHGFTRGDSAVLKDTLTACGKRRYRQSGASSEQEIIVTEKMSDGKHMIMVYDLRDKQWKAPTDYSSDRFFSTMRVDWSKSIDAMFSYNKKELYGVQGTRYAGVNFTKMCTNANDFAEPYSDQNVSDFKTLNQIDAMFSRGNKLYMFFAEDYYEYEIEGNAGGKFNGLKSKVKSVTKDFFKFTEACAPAGPPPAVGPTDGVEPPLGPGPGPGTEDTAPPQPAEDPSEESKKGGMMWIIIGIILLIIVIAIIAILVFVMMRKKKGGETSQAGSRRSGSQTGSRSGSKVGSRASGSRVGSRASGSQLGSKAGSRSPSTSPSTISRTQGKSPSQVSQRSALTTKSKGSKASSMSRN